MKNRAQRQSGFTLIEVMVGAAVALLVIGIVMGTFLSQQRAMQTLDLSREASSASRDAMLSMQEAIGRAGYGVDPRFAFDFRNYNCTWYTGAATGLNACRDKINAPDELVFVERDPAYYWGGNPASLVQGCDDLNAPCTGHAWQVTGFTTASPYKFAVNARIGDAFPKGQVVEVACPNGSHPQMGVVKTRVPTVTTAGTVEIELEDPVATGVNHYRENVQGGTNSVPAGYTYTLHDPCFDSISGGVYPNNAALGTSLFLVSRYRYFVTTLNGEPWLMLDRGIDYNGNGTTPENNGDPADLIPIAHGVEGMQVSYLLKPDPTGTNAAPDSGGDWVIGDAAGVVEEPDPTANGPVQNTPDTDPLRFTMNPANIRGVRLRLTVRSLLTDHSQGAAWAGDPAVPPPSTAIENRNDFTAVTPGRFRRYFTSVVVATPNLNSKDPFIF